MSSPNLGIPHLAAAQNQPEVTVNFGIDALDDSINLPVSIAITDADTTLTLLQLASGGLITITGALTSDRHLNLPASIGRSFRLKNGTTGGHSLIVQVTGAPGSIVTLAASVGLVELYSDGTNVSQLTPGSALVAVPNFADAETPSGSGTAFTLAHTPNPATSLLLVQMRNVLTPGTDYTITGPSITMTNAVPGTDTLLAWYRY